MRNDLTEIVIVMDASGSMMGIREDAVGGFNSFIEEQKKVPGDANLTVIFFDTNRYEKWKDGVPIKDCPVLREEYMPGALTPLLDALGRTINELGIRLKGLPEERRPGKVMVIVITDGLENASTEFNKGQVKEMIQHQESIYKWEFIFLGANMDAFHEAGMMGFKAANVANYAGTGKGIRAMFACVSSTAKEYRDSGQVKGLGKDIEEE